MWSVLGILFAAAPLVVWRMIARSRGVGLTIGGFLLAEACLLVAAQQGWLSVPRADAHLIHSVLAPLIVAFGAVLEHGEKGPGPAEWIPRRNGAIGFLGTQFALILVASLLYVLLNSEGSDAPPASAVPDLPPGLTVVSQGTGCGSGGCYRTVRIGSTENLSRQEIIRRLNRPHESCRPNGWLLDRRDLCIGVTDNGQYPVLYLSLSNLID